METMMVNRQYFFNFMKLKRNGPEKIKKQLAGLTREQEAALWRDCTQNPARRNHLH